MKKIRRNKIKRPSKEALLLRKLRQDKKLSVRKAADRIGKSCTWLAHFETGRFDAKPHDIEQVASIFKLSLDNIQEKLVQSSEESLINVREECQLIISRLDEDKIKAVYQMLKMF